MNDFTTPIFELQRVAHHLMYLGIDDAPIYSDEFARLNKTVLTQSDALFSCKGQNAEEEANLCLALLMGYNATIYGSNSREMKMQSILDRAFNVLEHLPASLLKVRLLTYCYGEVYEDSVLAEARAIIDSWNSDSLTTEQTEIIDELQNMEENQYPFEILED